MDILIIGLWILLFLAIPVALILIAGNIFGRDETVKIIGKLLVSLFVYLMATIISFFYLMVNSIEIHEPQVIDPNTTHQIVGLFVVYIYGFVGYLLCSFINGSFFKPWKMSIFNSKKPQTIFNKK